jgi:hypothetical protein
MHAPREYILLIRRGPAARLGWGTFAMKVALLGNCQVHGLREGLACHPGLDVTAFEVWRLTSEDHARFDPLEWDFVLSQPLSMYYQAMSRTNLRSSSTPCAFIHNLYFDGLCPDATYVGPPGKRVVGPMGDYHSSIIVDAFKADVDASEAARRLLEDGSGFDTMSGWKASFEELKRRETEVDVPFAIDLELLARQRRTFWTFNHPEVSLLVEYARCIVSKVFNRAPELIKQPKDDLKINGIWPIYPWVRSALDLPFGGETQFEIRGRPLTAADFVEFSYRAYDQARDRIDAR